MFDRLLAAALPMSNHFWTSARPLSTPFDHFLTTVDPHLTTVSLFDLEELEEHVVQVLRDVGQRHVDAALHPHLQ